MKNSVSDRSFYIESDDEDEEKDLNNVDQGNDSDDSHEWNDHDAMRKPSSYSMAWPQSYRQSIDLLGSVPSPNIGFLGTTSLSRLGSSFIVPPLIKRHPPVPDTIPSAKKPLLQPTDIDDQRRSSHILHPPHLLRGSTRNVISKVAHDHEVHFSGQCTFGQAVLNGINALCGVGILSTPYALKEGGWVALSVLFIFSAFSFYTGLLLRHCLDSEPGLETYPDIGQAAFGTSGRIFISVILYSELYACCIEYIILESDNLSSLFPNAHLSLGGLELNPHVLFAILTTLAILPTVYLRDLRILSYLSVMYAAVAIMGYTMFGEYTLSQYTLNMPQGLVATKLAVWTTVVNPFTKYPFTTYALSLTPVAKCLEELIPLNDPKFNLYSIFIRTMLVVSTLLVGLSVPFFGLVMSLIGSLLTMFVSLILPSACFLKIKWGKISQIQVALCVTVMIVAVVSSAFGSYSAISEIIEQLFG
ncbi:hypothetical protein HN51_022504 [Arachis hypogaea]